MTTNYAAETLDSELDDGTMPASLAELTEEVVGHRIVKAEREPILRSLDNGADALVITLDNGRRVYLVENFDCCAYTVVDSFLLHADKIDHIITGVGTTDCYQTWHIYADMGDVLTMEVGWSCGNPFYYGYGFSVVVQEAAK